MRFSIAVAAILGGLQAASALKLSPRNAVEREEQVSALSSVHGMDVAMASFSAFDVIMPCCNVLERYGELDGAFSAWNINMRRLSHNREMRQW